MQIKIGDRVQHNEYKDITGCVTAVKQCHCGLPGLIINNQHTLYHSDLFNVMQQVWRTVSKEISGGFFTWEVLQVIGEPIFGKGDSRYDKTYIECRDGTLIMAECFHHFTQEHAAGFLEYEGYCSVIDIV